MKIYTLREQLEVYQEYLAVKIQIKDWHACRDIITEIEVLEATIKERDENGKDTRN